MGQTVMGRRDEPELEELSKLLRRLETMEVPPKQENTRKAEPEPQAEYVGALRGAAPAKAGDQRAGSSFDARYEERGATGAASSRAGTSAIVIGATTAAVVSTVIAVGMVLWTNGGDKGDGGRRLTFYTPAEQGSTSRPAAASLPAAEAQPLLQRADAYLRSGKPDEARTVLEQAARAGSGVAALTLGAMYDPGRVAQFNNLGIKADPIVARAWYERAKYLGIAEANERLAELAAK
jgi:TPR repeat protein